MPSVKFAVAPEVLEWALRTSDLPAEVFEEQAKKYNISQWLSGEKTPTIKQIGDFATSFHIPFGTLFLKKVPETQSITAAFRTIENRPAKISNGLETVINTMLRRQAWMADEMKDDGNRPLSLIGKFQDEPHIDVIANYVREILDFMTLDKLTNKDNFFKQLRTNISQQRVLVMMDGTVDGNTHRRLDLSEVRAFVLLDEYAPLIFINTHDAMVAKIFSLLHEYVHILRGSDEVIGTTFNDTSEEQFINRVVAAILMPANQFKQVFALNQLAEIAKSYHVSQVTVGIRAKDLALITQADLDELIVNYKDEYDGKRSGKGGNFYYTAISRLDARYTTSVLKSYEVGETPTTKASSLLGISLKAFDNFKAEFTEKNLGIIRI